MGKEDGGPAFAQPVGLAHLEFKSPDKGLTVRDYFAAMAVNGLIAERTRYDFDIDVARRAFEIADAMIQERDK